MWKDCRWANVMVCMFPALVMAPPGSGNGRGGPQSGPLRFFHRWSSKLPIASWRDALLGASGAPVAGAQVWLNGDGQPTGSATTDADGRFVFGAVCEGAVSINASLGNSNEVLLQATGGNTNIVIRMSENRPYIGGASQTLTGTVYDSSGYPSTSARVVVTPSISWTDFWTSRRPMIKAPIP